jgi:hypothetical protein
MDYKNVITRIRLGTKKDYTDNILNLYMYGSRVYGTFDSRSDWDFIAIVKQKDRDQFSDNLINVNFFTVEQFQRKLNDHEIDAMECYFLPKKFILKNTTPLSFTLNKSKLRNSLSEKSSHSWVKAKKKLTVEKDFDLRIGQKSLFHSFRILEFGTQLATIGRIFDYGSCNDVWKKNMYSEKMGNSI